MTQYFRVELNGDAQHSATLIQALRQHDLNLFVDQQGYLIVSEKEWVRLEDLAQENQCGLTCLGQVQQAA